MNRLPGLFKDKRIRVISVILIIVISLLIVYQVYRYQDPFKYANVSIPDESYEGTFASQSMIHDYERKELIQAVNDTKILGEVKYSKEFKLLADVTFSKGNGKYKIYIDLKKYNEITVLSIGEKGKGEWKYIVISKDSAIMKFMEELYASRGMKLGGDYGIVY